MSRAFMGLPIDFGGICTIYPPTIEQIIQVGEKYGMYERHLTLSHEDIYDAFWEAGEDLTNLPTPLEYLIGASLTSPEVNFTLKEAFEFFVHEPITILYREKAILIGAVGDLQTINDLRCLDASNFEAFQQAIRKVCAKPPIPPPIPVDPRIAVIKAKGRRRDRYANKGALNLKYLMSSLCCMGIGLNPLNVGKVSYAAAHTLLRVYLEKLEYETDISSLLAGADSKKVKPKMWIRNLDEDEK